jgi:predicted aspartyl protease
MITGHTTNDGIPVIKLEVGKRRWDAIIDTGFNGELQLPKSLMSYVNARFEGHVQSVLANGETIEELSYFVDIPFDGKLLSVHANFEEVDFILVGTAMLRDYHLDIDFPASTVRLERVG